MTWAEKLRDRAAGVRVVLLRRTPERRPGDRYAPFFIVGSGRSGTTLLRRLLMRSPGLHIPPETYVLGQIIRQFRQLGGLSWGELLPILLANLEFHPEFETFGISLRPLVRGLAKTPPKRRSLAYLLDRFYRYHGEATGKQVDRWADKTPWNTFYLERLRDVFPDAKFVHLIRDGYDVAASYVAAGLYEDVGDAARRWKRSIEACRRFKARRPACMLEVRYEDLVTDPPSGVAAVCEFVGVAVPTGLGADEELVRGMGDAASRPHHWRVSEPVDTRSVGKGRRVLTQMELRRVEGVIGELRAELGYEHEEG